MFFIIAQVVTGLFMPLTITVSVLLLAFALRRKRIGRYLFGLGVVMLIFFSNNYLANSIMRWWEPKPVSLEQLESYDLCIVLGGITKSTVSDYDRVNFGKGADRLLHPILLYKQGKIKTLLLTGGIAALNKDHLVAEGELLAAASKTFGVDDSDIITETSSVNTYQNAKFSKQLIDKLSIESQKILLSTSAFHMRRAKACFNKQGIDVDILPSDYYSVESVMDFRSLFYPSLDAWEKWHIITREIMGLVAYKLNGYI